MARLALAAGSAIALLLSAAAAANGAQARPAPAARSSHRRAAAAARQASEPLQQASTDPVLLALKLAERYWHGTPTCGTPTIVTTAHQLPDSDYEATTNPEPRDSVVEMWTEVSQCTITINGALWQGWRQDDEFFQWFCDSMTHEVGHLFGHLDSGQTNPASITYPFLDGVSANFDSVPECKDVSLRYGSQVIRNEEMRTVG